MIPCFIVPILWFQTLTETRIQVPILTLTTPLYNPSYSSRNTITTQKAATSSIQPYPLCNTTNTITTISQNCILAHILRTPKKTYHKRSHTCFIYFFNRPIDHFSLCSVMWRISTFTGSVAPPVQVKDQPNSKSELQSYTDQDATALPYVHE